ncbi:unnamed protein product [Ostreobium quekettii]|uniref:Uncharacterized protein n=1 Tax=Ostreobium quekettii TaxID=121088 RepID=A0A8S1ILZ4_9CHLO|nr:unnamed protein product [Ostreobium quekettii]
MLPTPDSHLVLILRPLPQVDWDHNLDASPLCLTGFILQCCTNLSMLVAIMHRMAVNIQYSLGAVAGNEFCTLRKKNQAFRSNDALWQFLTSSSFCFRLRSAK